MDVPAVMGTLAQDVQCDRDRHVHFQEPQGKLKVNQTSEGKRQLKGEHQLTK